jgi:hypothetical protein
LRAALVIEPHCDRRLFRLFGDFVGPRDVARNPFFRGDIERARELVGVGPAAARDLLAVGIENDDPADAVDLEILRELDVARADPIKVARLVGDPRILDGPVQLAFGFPSAAGVLGVGQKHDRDRLAVLRGHRLGGGKVLKQQPSQQQHTKDQNDCGRGFLNRTMKTVGYELNALLGRRSDISKWRLKAALVFPLTPELGLIPMTEDLGREIHRVDEWAAKAGTTVAHLTADFFGGVGGHDCTIWIDGKAESKLDINDVLKRFGVKPEGSNDRFDTVGLGRHRSNEAWAAHAVIDPLGDSIDELVGKLKFLCLDKQVQESVRSLAVARLGKLKAALSDVESMLQDPEYGTRLSAAMALADIGEPAVPVLIQALKNEDPWSIVFALGKVGPPARSAAPHLEPLLRHSDWKIRLEVIQTLQKIGAPLKPIEPLLKDPEELVRNAARKALSG